MRWLFWLFLVIVITFSLIPAQDDIPGANDIFAILAKVLLGDEMQGDKIAHFIAYGSVSGAGTLAQIKPFNRLWSLSVSLVLLGALLERAQSLISFRMPDMLDFLANGLGVFIGWIIAYAVILTSKTTDENK